MVELEFSGSCKCLFRRLLVAETFVPGAIFNATSVQSKLAPLGPDLNTDFYLRLARGRLRSHEVLLLTRTGLEIWKGFVVLKKGEINWLVLWL